MSAELVDDKYKKFSEVVKADLVANTNKDYFENSEDINTALIGKIMYPTLSRFSKHQE